MSTTLPEYRGVQIERRGGRTKWSAKIVRQGHTFYLGSYMTPDLAAKAYDNGVYYTKAWADRDICPNYPNDWAGPDVFPPTKYVQKMLVRLNEKFPDFLKDKAKEDNLNKVDDLEQKLVSVCAQLGYYTNLAKQTAAEIVGRIRLNAVTLAQNARQIEKLENTIKGLQNIGGQQMFRPVPGAVVTPVDHQLAP